MINLRSVKGKRTTSSQRTASSQRTGSSPASQGHHAWLAVEPHAPLVQLVSLLPLVVLYEAAMPFVSDRSHAYHRIDAWSQWMLSRVGLSAWCLPGLLILLALLAAHMVRRDRWDIDAKTVVRLWGEALVGAVPLFVLYLVFTLPVGQLVATELQVVVRPAQGLGASIILAIGAGLFEEFVFRLVLVSALLWVLRRWLAVPSDPAELVAICLTAAVFASAHFFGPSPKEFTLLAFLFYTAAGIYLGAAFVLRGFATGAIIHATFNILLAVMVR